MLASRRSGSLVPRLITCAAAVYGILWISSFPRRWDGDEQPSNAHSQPVSHSDAPFPVEYDRLVVTIKTTATEAFAKLPMTLQLTDVVYHDNLNVVGDMNMDVGAFHVHDILENIDEKLMTSNPELERHSRQIRLAEASGDVNLSKDEDPEKEKESLAKLDKYKYVRMLEKAWQLKPDRDWYVFADADTFVVRANLMRWLGYYDPGKPIVFANKPAQKSSGAQSPAFVVSGQVLRTIIHERNVAGNWDPRISDFHSGMDLLEAVIHTELGIGINNSWPGLSPYSPLTVPYGPGIWCEDVLTLETTPELTSDLWRFQQDRNEHAQDPLRFADLWNRFLQPEKLGPARDDWDNLSSGPDNAQYNILFEGAFANWEGKAGTEDGRAADGEYSWEECAESCDNNQYCVQFSYSSIPMPNHNANRDTKCHLSRHIRLGGHVQPREVDVDGEKLRIVWKSGWKKERFERWAQQQRCKSKHIKM